MKKALITIIAIVVIGAIIWGVLSGKSPTEAISDVADTAGNVVEGAADTVGDVAGGAVELAGDAVDTVTDTASNVVDAAGDAVETVADTAGDVVEGAVEAAGDVAEAVTDTEESADDETDSEEAPSDDSETSEVTEEEATDAPAEETDEVEAAAAGTFAPYTAELASAGDKVVLAFLADWCPSCRSFENDVTENAASIPGDLTILRVDYDVETELKEKYGVTGQHTFVQIDANGELVSKKRGAQTLADLVNIVQ